MPILCIIGIIICILIITGIICLCIFSYKKNHSNESKAYSKSDNENACGDGYYIPDDDLTSKDCIKCTLEGCSKCQGTYKNNECIDCGNLISVYDDEKIIKCNDTCGEGYYIPNDDTSSKYCKKCSIKGCKKCKGTLFSEECTDCGNLINFYEDGKIIKCGSCPEGFFHPKDDSSLSVCLKCSVEGCSKCEGTNENNECFDCGDLIKVYENEKIIKCNNSCGDGYYIPDDDLTSKDCIKCSLEECSKCQGSYLNNKCTDCGNLYKIYQGTKIIKNVQLMDVQNVKELI